MALFDSKAKPQEEPKSKKIRPIVVETQNVAKEIAEVSRKTGLNPSLLDFDILEIRTYTRKNRGKTSSEDDWELVDKDALRLLDNSNDILNELFDIRQVYEIEIYTKNDEPVFKHFSAVVGANSNKCKVYLSVKAGSRLEAVPKFEIELLSYINKSKIRAGILVYIFDDMVEEFVSKTYAMVRVNGAVEYVKNTMILIADSYEPVPTIDDSFLVNYEKSDAKESNNQKINYSKRGFIHSVLKDELLMEYTKPRMGIAGRNCRGEFIKATEPSVKNAPTFRVDENIEVVDMPNTIEYRARISGYIVKEGDFYQIKSEMEINEVSFRKTGSVLTDLGSDVMLNVKESDAQKDAIGSGMEVEINELNIKGNVGSNSKIVGRIVTVDGLTHRTSIITADTIKINIHKGSAFGKEITVSRLEGGTIKGRDVTISQAVGGHVFAKNLILEVCGSNVKATASTLIEIRQLQGSENIFTIDPLAQLEDQSKIDENKAEIAALKALMLQLEREITSAQRVMSANETPFMDLKKRLVHYKKNDIKIPDSLLLKYKQFLNFQKEFEEMNKEMAEKKDKLELLTARSRSLQDGIKNARIINRDSWVGYNEVVFQLIEPKVRLVHKPAPNSFDKVFGVVEVEDGVFEIKAVRE